MWIKTIEGSLVNAANVEEFTILTPDDSSRNEYILRSGHGRYGGSNIASGTKDVCQMALDDIEHGILTGAIIVDLLKRETNNNTITMKGQQSHEDNAS